MARVTTALLCACALVAHAAAHAAPPKRMENKASNLVQEKTIVVRRLPNAHIFPFNLWPLPKFPVKDLEESYESLQYKTSVHSVKVKENKR